MGVSILWMFWIGFAVGALVVAVAALVFIWFVNQNAWWGNMRDTLAALTKEDACHARSP